MCACRESADSLLCKLVDLIKVLLEKNIGDDSTETYCFYPLDTDHVTRIIERVFENSYAVALVFYSGYLQPYEVVKEFIIESFGLKRAKLEYEVSGKIKGNITEVTVSLKVYHLRKEFLVWYEKKWLDPREYDNTKIIILEINKSEGSYILEEMINEILKRVLGIGLSSF